MTPNEAESSCSPRACLISSICSLLMLGSGLGEQHLVMAEIRILKLLAWLSH